MAVVGRLIVIVLALAATVFLMVGGSSCSGPEPVPSPSPSTTDAAPRVTSDDDADALPPLDRTDLTIGDRTFSLEIADEMASRTRGMMGRTSIPENEGMVFVFPDVDLRSFWMKNCLTDMDIMYLDPFGRITAWHEMTVEPPRGDDESEFAYELRLPGYPSVLPAQFAIEFAPGTIRSLGLGVGDRVDLDLEDLKARAR